MARDNRPGGRFHSVNSGIGGVSLRSYSHQIWGEVSLKDCIPFGPTPYFRHVAASEGWDGPPEEFQGVPRVVSRRC